MKSRYEFSDYWLCFQFSLKQILIKTRKISFNNVWSFEYRHFRGELFNIYFLRPEEKLNFFPVIKMFRVVQANNEVLENYSSFLVLINTIFKF